jgi:hypothetical protein
MRASLGIYDEPVVAIGGVQIIGCGECDCVSILRPAVVSLCPEFPLFTGMRPVAQHG